MSSIKQGEAKIVDSLQDFFWHYDNHILPYIQKEKPLPQDCKFCMTAMGRR